MKGKGVKYLFFISEALLLAIMLLASKSAGISCDEILHNDHSVLVYNYFASGGSDKSVLDTPESNLKYYGQSYDNLVTIISVWLGIEDVYTFRHYMSVIAGWAGILVAAFLAIWLSGYRAGLIVILLFAVSPTYFGHAQNNLKDIPFATAYIAGIYFMLRLFRPGNRWTDVILLTLSIAFCISIRAGGLILICYLFLVTFCWYFLAWLKEREIAYRDIFQKLLLITGISITAYFLSIVLWPYALQDPLRNVLESYRIMAHYPATFREIFEGKVEWSDFMPRYYLVKYMALTFPLLVIAGLAVFILFARRLMENKFLSFVFLVFTVLFPVLFVIILKSNLYSGWRQFLFVYPSVIILASAGISALYGYYNNVYIKTGLVALFLVMAIHPAAFMIRNHPYEYIYYNELAGGLDGAYTRYETDYYYTSHTEASEWLISYLEENNINDNVKVKATYPVDWFFRKHRGVETSWFRYEERSQHQWDYAIAGNRYIRPSRLKDGSWPPANAIHVIYADTVPICAVLERKTMDDYYGYLSLKEGKYDDAVEYFTRAASVNTDDEMIFYNFAGALNRKGLTREADSVLNIALRLNPDFEPALMYRGNIARDRNDLEAAAQCYARVIEVNRKYFEAYAELGEILALTDIKKARELLRTCLMINPGYKPAIIALGDTYSKTNPEIAEKYYEQARNK